MDVALVQASVDDLPALAEINRLAYTPETIAMFAFKNWPDEINMRNFFMARLKDRISGHDTEVFKAVNPVTNEIFGFVCWTLEDKDEVKSGFAEPVPNSTVIAALQMPDFLNVDFLVTTGKEVNEMKKLMSGSKHYCKYSPKAMLDANLH